MADAAKKQYDFQTEVKQLLNLMIHSLYSNQEIFLRELISNASDAVDKLRFLALSDNDLLTDDPDLQITIDVDKANNLLTIRDNGIGMTEAEVIEHLGTIAKSGTKSFVDNLTGDQAKDSQMIGQFGVGFYSAFMVADAVTVTTRRAGESQATRWASSGDGRFTIEVAEKAGRGTDVTLHLKEDCLRYLDGYELRNIIHKYSDHIALPIHLKKLPELDKEGKEQLSDEYEVINQAKALWTRSKSEISDEEYQEFYKHVAHDFANPLSWLHNHVEGKQEYTSLLYLPEQAPFDFWDRERKSGIKLYIKRVFIMDNADLLPPYLRFVKGVIDSADLPLNVSREILQESRMVESIRSAATKRILQHLQKMAKNKPEDYAKFWQAFGLVIKEGPIEDTANRELIASLLRFSTTHDDQQTPAIALDDYLGRMQEDQKAIYYVIAESFAAAKDNPQLEAFRKQGIEVVLLHDRIDEWLMAHLSEYQGKTFKSVAQGIADLEDQEDETDKEAFEAQQKDFEAVITQMKTVLGEQVKDVRISKRLTDSPSCVVSSEEAVSLHMQRMMKAAGQAMPSSAPILEVNPEHQLVQQLKAEQDDERFNDWTQLLFEQAWLAEAGQLEDPVAFVRRMNRYLR